MRILEIYRCDQGEGKLTGTDSVLVRVFGCDLDCHWCDTKYSINKKYHALYHGPEILSLPFLEVSSRAIMQAAGGARHIILSGGEPTIHEEFVELVNDFTLLGYHVTVETNGMHYIDPWKFPHRERILWSISPKLKRAYTKPADPDVLTSFLTFWNSDQIQFKFVISLEDEIPQALELLRKLPMHQGGTQVFLYPNGEFTDTLGDGNKLGDYFQFMKEMRKKVNQEVQWNLYAPRILPQMHVLLYGAKTRNV